MGWQVLICRPSGWAARDHMAVWRQMRRSGALPLGQGTWVIPDDLDGQGRADLLEDLIRRRHGHVLRFEVPDADPRLADVDELVHLTLDREWERLLAAIEEAGSLLIEASDPVLITTKLEELRRSYVELLERDPRFDSVAAGVATRLSSLVGSLPRELLSAPHGAFQVPRAQFRARIGEDCGRHCVLLEPFGGYGWELDLRDFEHAAYTPSPSRPDLRHGAVVLRCPVDEIPAQVAAINRRVEMFSYLASPNDSSESQHRALSTAPTSLFS